MSIRIYLVCSMTGDSAVSHSVGGYCLHLREPNQREGDQEREADGESRELLKNAVCRWWASAAFFSGRHFIFFED